MASDSMAILCLMIGYVGVACFVAFIMGRFDPDGPAWGAVIWPLIVPLWLFLLLVEKFWRMGRDS